MMSEAQFDAALQESRERDAGCFDEPLPTKPCPDCNEDTVDHCKTCLGTGEIEYEPDEPDPYDDHLERQIVEHAESPSLLYEFARDLTLTMAKAYRAGLI